MKNTLMFLLVSLLMAVSLTACGGANGNYGAAGQTDGITGDTGAYGNGSAGYDGNGAYGNGTAANGNGANGYNGSAAYGNGTANGSAAYGANDSGNGYVPDSSLVDDTRNVLADAGNAVNRAANGF